MNRTFRIRKDWFENGVYPAILRRSLIGGCILVTSISWWYYSNSMITLAVSILVLGERVFEFSSIPKTKKFISSISIQVTPQGILYFAPGVDGLLHPWNEMSTSILRNSKRKIRSITIYNTTKKLSKLKLMGFEAMDELAEIITGHLHDP